MREMRDEATVGAHACTCDGCVAARTPSCSPLTRAAAAELVKPGPGEVVVILGTPPPGFVSRAAQAVGPGGRVLVVPGSEPPPAAEERSDNVVIVPGVFRQVPLPAGVADLVGSCCTIHRSLGMRAVFEEIRRLLRPGGRFVVSDLVAEHGVPARDEGRYPAVAAHGPPCVSVSSYVGAVLEAGFRDLEVLQRTGAYDLGGLSVSSMVLAGTRP